MVCRMNWGQQLCDNAVAMDFLRERSLNSYNQKNVGDNSISQFTLNSYSITRLLFCETVPSALTETRRLRR